MVIFIYLIMGKIKQTNVDKKKGKEKNGAIGYGENRVQIHQIHRGEEGWFD